MRLSYVNSSSTIIDLYRRIKTYLNKGTWSYQITPFGFDSVPEKKDRAVLGEDTGRVYVLGYVQKAVDELNEGESIMFSKSNGTIKSKIILKNNGDIEIDCDGTVTINGNLTIEK